MSETKLTMANPPLPGFLSSFGSVSSVPVKKEESPISVTASPPKVVPISPAEETVVFETPEVELQEEAEELYLVDELAAEDAQFAEPDNILNQQYENQIRPCIDLIDSLRALGVEKEVGLPAIAVIGDQSSGKSSVLEALSGVCLPRGSGIVTRCPLELKLKKSIQGSKWSGRIKYNKDNKKPVILTNPMDVEREVRKAQDFLAGTGKGVSQDLITLEIESPNVPDLTLIDLPGITRVAVKNQDHNIGEQIKMMISKYITRQETINLAVVPSNVDIATTEALEMARKVDPTGERTLGILTKPDLVDKGTEPEVVSVMRNQVYVLKKGYMIVKCRGQSEIQNNISLEDALNNERVFFETHEHFNELLNEGRATIPALAEKLTFELVEHIRRLLPNVELQIKTKLKDAEEKLRLIGTGVPESEMERLTYLIDKIRQFGNVLTQAVHGEEDVKKGSVKLFTRIRKHFNSWERSLKESADDFAEEIRDDMKIYEEQHRGRELAGFISFRVFENIARRQIETYEEPAVGKLNEITELVRASFSAIAAKHFGQYPNLYASAKGKLENICSDQQKEAENVLRNQFRMENIIYCQDSIYGRYLKNAREDATKFCSLKRPQGDAYLSVVEMTYHLQAYFKNAIARLGSQIPIIIQHYVLHQFSEKLQNQMLQVIQVKENINLMLVEKQDLSQDRKNLKGQIDRLKKAKQRLARFPN
ncbi:interferon-induced GTP-binding protein Mx2-like isoform X2 [Hyperolius riggenbachi]